MIRLEDKQVTPFEEAKASLLQGGSGAVFNEWIRSTAAELGIDVNPDTDDGTKRHSRSWSSDSTDPSAEPTGAESSATGLGHAVSGGTPRADDLLAHVPDGPVPSSQQGERLLDLVRVMARLRGPGGCPWDAEQTHQSLARHLLEETHELLEAIDAERSTTRSATSSATCCSRSSSTRRWPPRRARGTSTTWPRA